MPVAELLSLAPIQRALIAVLAAGVAFPLSGVLVLEMNLITLRFALMHGALLGGAVAMAASITPFLPTLIILIVLVGTVGWFSRKSGQNPGFITAMLMTVAVAGAALVVYRFNVPAKDTLALLWGNVYALNTTDLVTTVVLSALILIVVFLARRQLIAVLFDPEVAWLAGINEPAVYYAILGTIALTVTVAMRLVGALLLDVFLLLPALAARQVARSGTQLFAFAALAGLISAVLGFAVSLAADIPLSTAATAPAILLVALGAIPRLRRKSIQRGPS